MSLDRIIEDLDIHAPECEDDGGELGLIYVDGWGYTPNDMRDFIAMLEGMVEAAEAAAEDARLIRKNNFDGVTL